MLSSKTKQFLSPGSLIVHASTCTTRSKATGSTSTHGLSHTHTTLSDKKKWFDTLSQIFWASVHSGLVMRQL